jgi:very-short-patch-repair endonuclease
MREEMRSHQQLRILATRQYGVVSHRQMLRLGYSESAIGRAAAAGRLHRVYRGVYAVGHMSLSAHGRSLAAVLACGRGALLSHGSAAWAWGLFPGCPACPDVSVPTRGRRRDSIRLHHAPAIGGGDRAIREHIPVTAVPRTLLDLAASISSHRLERVIERSEQLRLFDLRAVDALLARTRGHHGAGRLRRTLSAYRESSFTRSGLERRFLELARQAGLPTPSANVYVAGYELDVYWPRERFCVELDGYEHHRTRAAFERDRLRQEDLKLAGIEMIRLTATRLAREPEAAMARLSTLLEERRRQAKGSEFSSS